MIVAGGTVDLTGSTIFPQLFGTNPTNGEVFTLIDNDGVDAVTGTFAGYPEGASYVSGPVTLTISYVGGDGNDVVFTASVAATPTPVPTSVPSSSSSFSTPDAPYRDPGVPRCDAAAPSHSPDLFQIDATTTSARLYFAPAGTPNGGYFIAYGTSTNAEGHGVYFDHSDMSGVIDFTIDALKPNTTYYFKVRGQSGCMPGDWSQIMKVKTGPRLSFYHYTPQP